ncbi:aldo/keto reductase [Planomonospora sp. ID82291]|uniref:aldo/keto reductase n=1 Tax=Planomonospora sp. ID82291 TaxID=2738136 RepID=UPI0027DAF015|nr:aldo/keto reductase [Planomonospora sp. ID82291]
MGRHEGGEAVLHLKRTPGRTLFGGPFAEVAAAGGVPPQQVCLAWELARSPVMIPIPGAGRPESILGPVRAAGFEPSQEEPSGPG